jgi:hypothetical protein
MLYGDGVVQFHHHGFVDNFFFHYIVNASSYNFLFSPINFVFPYLSMSSIDQRASKKLCSNNVENYIDEVIINLFFRLLASVLNEFFDVEFCGLNYVTPSIPTIVTSIPFTNYCTFELLWCNDGS